jgi:spermidine/putrescine-binding protein
MNSSIALKNRLIDKIFASQNSKLLEKLEELLDEASPKSEGLVNLSSEQIEMLAMGEEDIKQGRFISQEKLDERDQEWLE